MTRVALFVESSGHCQQRPGLVVVAVLLSHCLLNHLVIVRQIER